MIKVLMATNEKTVDDAVAEAGVTSGVYSVVEKVYYSEAVAERAVETSVEVIVYYERLAGKLECLDALEHIRKRAPKARVVLIVNNDHRPGEDAFLSMVVDKGIYDVVFSPFNLDDLVRPIVEPATYADVAAWKMAGVGHTPTPEDASAEEPGSEEPAKAQETAKLEVVKIVNTVTRQEIIAVWSPVGGVGKSIAAVNLGYLIAEASPELKVALIDLNYFNADLDMYCGVEDTAGLRYVYDLIEDKSLTSDSLKQLMVAPFDATPNLSLLTGAYDPLFDDKVNKVHFEALISRLRAMFDVIILDTNSTLTTDATVTAVMQASTILIPVVNDYTCVRHVARYLTDVITSASLLDIPLHRCRIMVNKLSPSGVPKDILEQALPVKPEVYWPYSKAVQDSINAKKPVPAVALSTNEAKALRQEMAPLVARFTGREPANKKPSLLGRVLGRKA